MRIAERLTVAEDGGRRMRLLPRERRDHGAVVKLWLAEK